MSKTIRKYLFSLYIVSRKPFPLLPWTQVFHCFGASLVSAVFPACVFTEKLHFSTHQNVPVCCNYVFLQSLFQHSIFYSHYGHELYLHSNCFSSIHPRLLSLGSILLSQIVSYDRCMPLNQLWIFSVELLKAF